MTCLFRANTRRHWAQDSCATAAGSRGTKITGSGISELAVHQGACTCQGYHLPNSTGHSVTVVPREDRTSLDTGW